MMRIKAFLLLIALACTVGAAIPTFARGRKPLSQLKQLKLDQKMQRRQLKLQEKALKRSFHGRRIPRAERIVAKDRYKRHMRDLRTHQKDELEQMKDQLRLQRAAAKHGLSG